VLPAKGFAKVADEAERGESRNFHERIHEPIPEVGKWFAKRLVRGTSEYYGVPRTKRAVVFFRFQVGCPLANRAFVGGAVRTVAYSGNRMRRLITPWLPVPTVCHPYPLAIAPGVPHLSRGAASTPEPGHSLNYYQHVTVIEPINCMHCLSYVWVQLQVLCCF